MNSRQLQKRLQSLEESFHTALTADEIKIGWLKTRVKTIAEISKRAANLEIESGERLDAVAMRQVADAYVQRLMAIAVAYIPDEASRHDVFTTLYEMPFDKTDDGQPADSVLHRVRDTIDELAADESDDDREVLLSQLSEQLSKVLDGIARTLADTVPMGQVAMMKASLGERFQVAAGKYLSDEQLLVLDCELANL